jgi:hypothetical protein
MLAEARLSSPQGDDCCPAVEVMGTQIHVLHGLPSLPGSQGSGFTGEVCETVSERAVLLDGGARFLGSCVFALPGG